MPHRKIREGASARLKEARLAARLSQEDVARELNVKRQTISAWERAMCLPTVCQLYCLGILYGVSVDYVLYGIRMVPAAGEKSMLDSVLGRVGVEPVFNG